MLPYTSYGLHALTNEVTHINQLQSHCEVVQACDAEFTEGFPKESVATDRGEDVESFSKRCIIQLFLESC